MCWDIYKQGSFQKAILPSPTTTHMHCFINIAFQGSIWKSTVICLHVIVFFFFFLFLSFFFFFSPQIIWLQIFLLLLPFFFFFPHKSFGSRSFFFLFLFGQNRTELGLFRPVSMDFDWFQQISARISTNWRSKKKNKVANWRVETSRVRETHPCFPEICLQLNHQVFHIIKSVVVHLPPECPQQLQRS